MIGDTGSAFLMLNRNKRSVTLNLKNAEAKVILRKLAEKADVFVESFQHSYNLVLGDQRSFSFGQAYSAIGHTSQAVRQSFIPLKRHTLFRGYLVAFSLIAIVGTLGS
jgi:hypothetical protein